MRITFLTKALILSALCASTTLPAAEVFSWKNAYGVNTYSDAPYKLRPATSNIVNVRTQTVASAVAEAPQDNSASNSIADQQRALSEQIAKNNKQVEAQNKKIAEQNAQQKADNCKAARMNRQFAEGARIANREALIQRYESDISKFCH